MAVSEAARMLRTLPGERRNRVRPQYPDPPGLRRPPSPGTAQRAGQNFRFVIATESVSAMSIPATVTNSQTAPAATALQAASGQEVLTFTIDDQYYGLDLLTVREIRAWTEVTPLPNTPSFVRGVINLRG